MSHLDRKELKQPDAFLSRAEQMVDFINSNSRLILTVIGVLFLVGLGAAFTANMKSRKAEAAASEYYLAQKAFADALKPLPKTDSAWDQKLGKEIAKLDEIAKEYKGSQGAFQALLLIGDAYFDHANAPKAAEYYERAVGQAPSGQAKPLAQLSLAYALENAGRTDQAIDVLQRVVSSEDKAVKGDAFMALARNYEAKGDKEKARQQYDQAIKDFPNSSIAKMAEAHKKSLGG